MSTEIPAWTQVMHWAPGTDIKPGDNVYLTWNSAGRFICRVIKVYPDGSIRCVRRIKKDGRWSAPVKFNRRVENGLVRWERA